MAFNSGSNRPQLIGRDKEKNRLDGEIQPVFTEFVNSVYFFLAAGFALADFAGFLASVFFAATSFFAAISVAPLKKLRAPCVLNSRLSLVPGKQRRLKSATPQQGE